jgi:four helix bundle protein
MRNAECGVTNELRDRTKGFAIATVKLVQSLPRTRPAFVLGDQLLRSGTSVAANYRAACRARSRKEFVAKLGIVEEEADESLFWLDLLRETGLVQGERVALLIKEGDALLAMTVASIRTARQCIPHSALRTPHS